MPKGWLECPLELETPLKTHSLKLCNRAVEDVHEEHFLLNDKNRKTWAVSGTALSGYCLQLLSVNEIK